MSSEIEKEILIRLGKIEDRLGRVERWVYMGLGGVGFASVLAVLYQSFLK